MAMTYLNIGLILVLIFKPQMLSVLKITLLIYTVLLLAYYYFSYKLFNRFSRLTTYHSIFCILILLVTNSLLDYMGLNVYLIINLCICFFLTISFGLYHAEVYNIKLLTTANNIKLRDSELIEAEKRIQYLAYTHPDTGLKNAHKLHIDLKNPSYDLTGVCMLSIKNFKLLLTLIGYRESKAVLMDISKALISFFNTCENTYHFSTDRFIILYTGSHDQFEVFIKGILSLFSTQNLCAIDLNPCIGATYITNMHFNYDTLIQELELASHIAKYTDNRYALYKSEMSKKLQTNLELEAKLKEATLCNHWEVYLQPKVNVCDNQITGAEALIRWRGNETTIPPDIFIPLAEKLGLINQIGRYVIHTTFKYVHDLDKMGFKNLKFSINLSVAQLMELDLVSFIENTAKKFSISHKHIIFEITESILIHNMAKVATTLTQLKQLGFRFSLDDFGTGYSSLAYLSKLNFDELKFDKEFIKNIKSEHKNLIILECVTKMGQDLGLDIVTEGIEDESQYNTIKSLGCNYYQGYYYSRPVPFDNFLSLLLLTVA